jgi:hypothetical protein
MIFTPLFSKNLPLKGPTEARGGRRERLRRAADQGPSHVRRTAHERPRGIERQAHPIRGDPYPNALGRERSC